MRNSEGDAVAFKRSGRRLGCVESESQLAEYFLHRWEVVIPVGAQHHHDRVSQSRISVHVFSVHFGP
jgi:hypothetical protein